MGETDEDDDGDDGDDDGDDDDDDGEIVGTVLQKSSKLKQTAVISF